MADAVDDATEHIEHMTQHAARQRVGHLDGSADCLRCGDVNDRRREGYGVCLDCAESMQKACRKGGVMRAEYLAAYLAGSARSPDSVGYSTKPYDEKAAYLARVSPKAMTYAEVAYFGWVTEEGIERIITNVQLDAMRWWRPVGEAPEGLEARARWKSRQITLIEKLSQMALLEALNPAIGNPKKVEWRAARLGITDRQWRRDYRERYDRITALLNDWGGEFLGKVNVNQRDLEAL